MYLDQVGEIIATRHLYLVSAGDDRIEVLVVIGKPQQSNDSLGYFCPFQIRGSGSEKVKYAMGLDAVQALQAVMGLIGANLQLIGEYSGNSLRWEGDNAGGLGFTVD